MTNTVLEQLVEFNTVRELDKQEFNLKVASMNILEELLEAHGVHDNKDRDLAKFMYMHLSEIKDDAPMMEREGVTYAKPTVIDQINAFNDIQVFAFGEPLKMGYSPILCLEESTREISTRVGEVINGKFVKDTSDEAKANWYTPDYSKAKIEN